MKLVSLLLDYDGTLADDRRVDTQVRMALAEARGQGLIVILVTGRILSDLSRVLAQFDLFDAIVAENGAVLHFPRTGRSTLLAPPADSRFLEELRQRGLPHAVGECVVELDAGYAHTVLSIVREHGLPLVLSFNRERLMVLPQSVAKGSGAKEAARALRISLHNALAVGDAENDHDLLRVCEYGVAVSWGSPALQRAADEVFKGDGPPAIAGLIHRWTEIGCLPIDRPPRRFLTLGTRADGSTLTLAILGRNVLIAGAPQSGKSWIAGLLCEQLVLQHYSVCVIDPEGDYATLDELPGMIVLSANDKPPALDEIEHMLAHADVSVVVDLSKLSLEKQRTYVPALLERLAAMRRTRGLPHRIVLDEAHYFLRDAASMRVLDFEQMGYTLVTFRVSELDPSIFASTQSVLVAHESDRQEAESLRLRFGPAWTAEEWFNTLSTLELDEAALLPGTPESGTEVTRFRTARRLTSHVRHKRKYLATAVACDRAFVFRRDGADAGLRANSLQQLITVLSSAPEQIYAGHLERGDFSRWIADVFHDAELSNEIARVEHDWCTHQKGRPHDRIVRAVLRRYAITGKPPIAAGAEIPRPRDSIPIDEPRG